MKIFLVFHLMWIAMLALTCVGSLSSVELDINSKSLLGIVFWNEGIFSSKNFQVRRIDTEKFFLILFSGGSSGIGRGTVLLLSKLGCSVAFGGRNKDELDKVAAQCKETRSDAQVLVL